MIDRSQRLLIKNRRALYISVGSTISIGEYYTFGQLFCDLNEF